MSLVDKEVMGLIHISVADLRGTFSQKEAWPH